MTRVVSFLQWLPSEIALELCRYTFTTELATYRSLLTALRSLEPFCSLNAIALEQTCIDDAFSEPHTCTLCTSTLFPRVYATGLSPRPAARLRQSFIHSTIAWYPLRGYTQTRDPTGPRLSTTRFCEFIERIVDHNTDDGFWRRINRRFPFIGHWFCAACLLTYTNEDDDAVAAYRDGVRRRRREARCWRLISLKREGADVTRSGCLRVWNRDREEGTVTLGYHDEYVQHRDAWQTLFRESDALRQLYDDLVDEQFAVALMLAHSGDVDAALALRELLINTAFKIRRSVAKLLGDVPFRLIPGIMQAWDTWRDARSVSAAWPTLVLDLKCSDTMWSFPCYSFEELSNEQRIHWLHPFLEALARKFKRHRLGWPVAVGTFPI